MNTDENIYDWTENRRKSDQKTITRTEKNWFNLRSHQFGIVLCFWDHDWQVKLGYKDFNCKEPFDLYAYHIDGQNLIERVHKCKERLSVMRDADHLVFWRDKFDFKLNCTSNPPTSIWNDLHPSESGTKIDIRELRDAVSWALNLLCRDSDQVLQIDQNQVGRVRNQLLVDATRSFNNWPECTLRKSQVEALSRMLSHTNAEAIHLSTLLDQYLLFCGLGTPDRVALRFGILTFNDPPITFASTHHLRLPRGFFDDDLWCICRAPGMVPERISSNISSFTFELSKKDEISEFHIKATLLQDSVKNSFEIINVTQLDDLPWSISSRILKLALSSLQIRKDDSIEMLLDRSQGLCKLINGGNSTMLHLAV